MIWGNAHNIKQKVTEYKVVCRVSVQLCEEKNAQKKKTWPLHWQWRHPGELGFFLLAYTLLYECGLF